MKNVHVACTMKLFVVEHFILNDLNFILKTFILLSLFVDSLDFEEERSTRKTVEVCLNHKRSPREVTIIFFIFQ